MAESEGAASVVLRTLKSVVFYIAVIVVYSGIIFSAGYFTGKHTEDKDSAVDISRYQLGPNEHQESVDRQSIINRRITEIIDGIESGDTSAIGSIQRIQERISGLESALREIGVLVESADSAAADISRSADGVIGD